MSTTGRTTASTTGSTSPTTGCATASTVRVVVSTTGVTTPSTRSPTTSSRPPRTPGFGLTGGWVVATSAPLSRRTESVSAAVRLAAFAAVPRTAVSRPSSADGWPADADACAASAFLARLTSSRTSSTLALPIWPAAWSSRSAAAWQSRAVPTRSPSAAMNLSQRVRAAVAVDPAMPPRTRPAESSDSPASPSNPRPAARHAAAEARSLSSSA
ncbi:hypothetical protein [Actinosynnema mirum]|uniref:hypothetical protein n=1 Tax=Actinosynnema mirum TaxID=40567 RepID=UPI000674B1DE|nr:hypothetical protein [Actinosynnema mirum]